MCYLSKLILPNLMTNRFCVDKEMKTGGENIYFGFLPSCSEDFSVFVLNYMILAMYMDRSFECKAVIIWQQSLRKQ